MPSIRQNLKPFTSYGDVSIWVKNYWVGHITPDKQTNKQIYREFNFFYIVYLQLFQHRLTVHNCIIRILVPIWFTCVISKTKHLVDVPKFEMAARFLRCHFGINELKHLIWITEDFLSSKESKSLRYETLCYTFNSWHCYLLCIFFIIMMFVLSRNTALFLFNYKFLQTSGFKD